MIELLLERMAVYGPLALGLALLLGAAGLPLPSGVLLLATAALARQGLLDGPVTIAVGLAGVVLGDVASYAMGRLASERLEGYLRQRRATPWGKAQEQFNRHGGLAIWLTRVVLTSLDVPTSLIAGGSGYPFRRFLAYGLAGRVTWLALYGGLGYAFGCQWPLLSQAISRCSGWLALGALVAGGIYVLHSRSRPTVLR
jgi:membrane protein DedA with SNARE-associated domain